MEEVEAVIFQSRERQATEASISHKLDIMVEDIQLGAYVDKLSDNKLVADIREHIDLIGGASLRKSYGVRKALILTTLFAGAVLASIGSVTFLVVAQRFPEEFANFTNIPISEEVSDGFGQFLGWTNVVIEAIFYTWTVSGILPPLQPKPKQQGTFETSASNVGFFRRCATKVYSWLPSLGELGLAAASALPLTLLSLIDQEADGTADWIKYSVVSSIGLITLVSNKFFLSVTHQKFKSVYLWMRGEASNDADADLDLLEQTKKAFLEATARVNQKIKHLSQEELSEFIASLKKIAEGDGTLDEGNAPQNRWVKLVEFMFGDLSYEVTKIRKIGVILIPALAIFAALSWFGLIATVPNGVKEKLHASDAWQYILMILAGIPLIEVGLLLGGSTGLTLSRMGDGTRSLTMNLTTTVARYVGYIPLCIFGLFSFGTNATLTIQQFESTPVVTWMLLPSATLGIDLINVVSGVELWNEILVTLSTAMNADKKLFLNYVEFLKYFYMNAKESTSEEIAEIILNLNAITQEKIKQFIPGMKDKELNEFIDELTRTLQLKLSSRFQRIDEESIAMYLDQELNEENDARFSNSRL